MKVECDKTKLRNAIIAAEKITAKNPNEIFFICPLPFQCRDAYGNIKIQSRFILGLQGSKRAVFGPTGALAP